MFNNQVQSTGKSWLYKVYAWMSLGLALTAGIAYYVAQSAPILSYIYQHPWLIFGMLLAQIMLVIALSAGIQRMSMPVAAAVFLAYSALTGFTLSGIFLIYTATSIATTFIVAAGMFLAMAIYGYVTNADLSSMGSFLFMGLIGLILAGLVNMFLQSTGFSFFIAGAGVIIFSLLTAYDIQKLKMLSYQLSSQDASKIALLGALTLYLDFVNLFLYLLQLFGQKKDK